MCLLPGFPVSLQTQKDTERSRLPGSTLRLEEYSMKFKKGRLILPDLTRPISIPHGCQPPIFHTVLYLNNIASFSFSSSFSASNPLSGIYTSPIAYLVTAASIR